MAKSIEIVSSGELQKQFGRYSDEAMIRPVGVSRNGRVRFAWSPSMNMSACDVEAVSQAAPRIWITTPSKRFGQSSPPPPSATTQKPRLALPKLGEVINYSYLWEYEFRKGRDEGVKDRPVAVVLVA